MEFIDEFEGIENQKTFFTPAEKSLLVYSCIIGISTKAVSSPVPHPGTYSCMAMYRSAHCVSSYYPECYL